MASIPAPGFTVADFTGIHPDVVAAIKDVLPDSMSTTELAADLIRRSEAGKIDPPLSGETAHVFALVDGIDVCGPSINITWLKR
jgi:hypothetical protein